MNTMTQVLDQALTTAEARDSQPQLMEIPSQQFNQVREDLATSKNDEVRFNRSVEMIAQSVAAIPDVADPRQRILHLRQICCIAAASIPGQELTPATDLVQEWQAANATIDVLEDEKQKLRDALAEAQDQIERLEWKAMIADREARGNDSIMSVVRLAVPYGQNTTRINLRAHDNLVSQIA